MRKLVLIISCLIPVLSFAGNTYNANIDAYQEQCAKEKDPMKRQGSCLQLDRPSQSNLKLPEFQQEIITV